MVRNELLKAYNNFIEREYGDEPLESLTSDILNIAYTEYELVNGGGMISIQCSYSLEQQKYIYTIESENDSIIYEENCTIEEAIEDLTNADFNDMLRNGLDVVETNYGEVC